MTESYGERLRAAFDAALSVPEGERAAFVVERFSGDEKLCRELLGMLGHVGAEDSFLQPLESEAVRDILGTTKKEKREPKPMPDLEGKRLADRYVVGTKLGEGGSGVVYEGVDRLTHASVAVKVLRHAREGARHDLRREAAALRLLRLPGIVQLLDEGVEGDLVYLVTERVDGAPFPAREGALSWDELDDLSTALLETVDRMHRAGIVHGDLKPGNVLVRADGVPVILDLGIAQGPRAAATDGKRRGTFRYVAPEQLRDGVVTPRADLYSVGVMLYEALLGEPYRSEPSVLLTRLGVVTNRPPKSLDGMELDAPPLVRDAINRLLSTDPEARPESARDVLAALHPVSAARRARRDAPFVGRELALGSLLSAAHTGASLDLRGAPGSGRTRLLEEAARVLVDEGVDVAWVEPSDLPEPDGRPGRRIESSGEGDGTAHVRAHLTKGGVLLADDVESLPERVQAALDAGTAVGTVIRTWEEEREGATQLEALDADSLRGLFAGGDRLHHIPEDAAEQLWRRTGGLPGRVFAELDAWSRAGLGWWDGGRYSLRRQDIEQLERGVRAFSPRPAGPAPDAGLTDEQRRLLLAIELAGPRASVPLMAAALEIPQAEIEQATAEMEARHLVDRTPGGGWQVLTLPANANELHATAGPDLHARIARALPLGDERRLMHTVAAGRLDEVPAESIAAARALLREGDAEGARTAVAEGLGALALHPDAEATVELLRLQVQAAMQIGTKGALDEALHRLGCYPADAQLDPLERLARGLIHALDGQPERAMEELPVPSPEMPEDERRRAVSARLFAARFLGEDALREQIVLAERLAEETSSPVIGAAAAGARAWLLYQKEEYSEAGALHLQAARAAPNATTRVSSLLNAASAYLDAGNLDRAEQLASEALEFASARRHAPVEARAEYIMRAAAYRRGDDLEPDLALALASRELGTPHLAALIDLNEASIAWRKGRLSAARRLAEDAARVWQGEADRWQRLLVRALALASSPAVLEEEGRELLEECGACPMPKVAIQAAWLVGQASELLVAAAADFIEARVASIPAHERDRPLEVLSISEAMK